MDDAAQWDDEPAELKPLPYVPTVMGAELFPDDVAAWAVSVTPGSAVRRSLAVLDPRRMTHEGRVDAVAALDRQVAWSLALQDRFLAMMAEDPAVPTPLGELGKEWVREQVACVLRLSAGARRQPTARGPGTHRPAARHVGIAGTRGDHRAPLPLPGRSHHGPG